MTKNSLIKKNMRFAIESKAQILLLIKFNGNTTVYSSEKDFIRFFEQCLNSKKSIRKYSNRDYRRILIKEYLFLKKKGAFKKVDNNNEDSEGHVSICDSLEEEENSPRKNRNNFETLVTTVNKIIPNSEVPSHIMESINKRFDNYISESKEKSNKANEKTYSDSADKMKGGNIKKRVNTNTNNIPNSKEDNNINSSNIENVVDDNKKRFHKKKLNFEMTQKNIYEDILEDNTNSFQKNTNVGKKFKLEKTKIKNTSKFEEQEKTIKKSQKSVNSKEFSIILDNKAKQSNNNINENNNLNNPPGINDFSPSKFLNAKRPRNDSIEKPIMGGFSWNSFSQQIPFPQFSYAPVDHSVSPMDANMARQNEMYFLGHPFLKTPGNSVPLLNSMPLISPLRPDQNYIYYGLPYHNDFNK